MDKLVPIDNCMDVQIDTDHKSVPLISYNPSTNTLSINVPKDLKIVMTDSLNVEVLGEFNLLAFGMNLLSLHNNINIDSYQSAIYLNSRRCKQLHNLKSTANHLLEIMDGNIKILEELKLCLTE